MRRFVAVVLLLAACGDAPDHAACLNACDAQNKCAGAKQERCSGLCNAKPKDCASEYTAWWTCAGAHLDQACSGFMSSCGSEFDKWSICAGAFCFAHPLDSNCYY